MKDIKPISDIILFTESLMQICIQDTKMTSVVAVTVYICYVSKYVIKVSVICFC